MKKYLSYIAVENFIRENIQVLTYLYLLNVLYIAINIVPHRTILYIVFSIIVTIFIPLSLLIIVSFGKNIVIRKILKLFILCLFIITSTYELVFFLIFNNYPNPNAIISILATTSQEAVEFLENVNIISVFCMLLVYNLALIILSKFISKFVFSFLKRIQSHILTIVSISVCILFTVGIIKVILLFIYDSNIKNVVSDKIYNIKYNLIESSSLTRVCNDILVSIKDIRNEDIIISAHDNLGPYQVVDDNKIKNVVFILGESASRNHMSLYGYRLNTTPHLDLRNKNNELIVFSDTISGYSGTEPSIQRIFSFFNNEKTDSFFYYHNIFDILDKSKNTKSIWISNQEKGGYAAIATKLYTHYANKVLFTNDVYTTDIDSKRKLDEEILPILQKEILKNKNDKTNHFYLVHLLGSHFNYKLRYPKRFDKFSEKDEVSLSPNLEDKIVLQRKAEYDNSILYSDFIINEIIKQFENEDSIVIYISDHAEEVCDNSEHCIFLHPYSNKYTLEIPFVVWISQSLMNKYPEIKSNFKSNSTKPYMTDDMIHTLLDLMNIYVSDYEESRSIFNPKFNSNRERIANGFKYKKD